MTEQRRWALTCGLAVSVLMIAACVGDEPGPSPGTDTSSSSSGEAQSGSSGTAPGGGSSSGEPQGGSSSSSGGEPQSSSSSSSGSAECPLPLPATVNIAIENPPPGNQCGALPVAANQDDAQLPTEIIELPLFVGGEIAPGQYELVWAQGQNAAQGPQGVDSVYVFRQDHKVTLNQIEFDNVGAGIDELTMYGQGVYSTNGSMLSFDWDCKHNSPTESWSYRAFTEGCDDLLELGNDSWLMRLKRRRQAP